MSDLLFKKPDGSVVYVDSSEAEAAKARGYVQTSDAQIAAAGEPVQAGVEAAVRTALPLGIGQSFMTGFQMGRSGKTEAQVNEEQQLRAQENPVAKTLGTGVGFLAPSKVLRGLAPVATTLKGMAAVGALEGTALGVSEAVNESILEDKPLTAENLAANAIASGVAGGAFDFGTGVVSKGVSALIKKAGGTTLAEALKEAGTKSSLGMIETKKWAKAFGASADDIARVAREEGVLSRATSLDEASVAAAKAAEERLGSQVSEALAKAQYLKPPDQEGMFKAVMGAVEPFARNPLARDALRDVKSATDQLVGQGSTWSEMWDLQRVWGKMADRGDTVRSEVLDAARKGLRDFVTSTSPKISELGSSISALNSRYAALGAFASGLEEAALANRVGSTPLRDIALGGAFGGPKGAAAAVGAQQLKKRGGFVLGETLNQLAESSALKRISESLQRSIGQRLMVAPEALGPFRSILESAASQGAEALFETHAQLANSKVGPEYLATLGMEPETPERLAATGQKLAVLESIRNAAASRDVEQAAGVDALFGSAPGRKGSVAPALSVKDFDKFMAANQSLLKDPESAFRRISPELLGAAPETMGLTAQTVMRAAQYLDSRAPKSPYAGMPVSVAPEWEPSAVDLDRFNRVKEAVESPGRVLKNMANGYISPDQVDALKAVYPALYSKLQQQIGERLASWQKPLTYQQRLSMSSIVGPLAFGMSAQQIQVIQQATALASVPQQGQSGSVKRPDGRQDVNEEQIQTEAQKLEART